MRGPDLLAAIRGELLAIYVYSSLGLGPENPSEYGRIILGHLALPMHAKFILATTRIIDDVSVSLFDEVWLLGDDEAFPRRMAGDFPRVAAHLGPLREAHHRRFLSRGAEANSDRVTTSQAISLEMGNLRLPSFVNVDNGQLYAGISSTDEIAISRRVASLSWVASVNDFSSNPSALADIATMIKRGDARLARHHLRATFTEVPTGFDPYKPLRAAEFAGYCVHSQQWGANNA
ncbi:MULTISPECIES: hypothetical protein [unclassified Luteococcus]|uniref:hypothetical protein n=1 Tax=unclassified Luteococcus TaxID=2639923 RepID=UPI00313E630E